MKHILLLMLTGALTARAGTFPDQPAELRPQKTEGGVLFQCRAPAAKAVYIAGDFNDWAQNDKGRITDSKYAMEGPDKNGNWRKVVKLDPGTHSFQFSINGAADSWFAPANVEEHDKDQNATFRVTAKGVVIVRSARNPLWRPQVVEAKVLFQLYAPEAHIVYLSGSFNNWGNNKEGLVSDPKFAMTGPSDDGLWRAEVKLTAGRHLYQFVMDGDKWITDPNASATDRENHSILEVK